MVCMANVTTQLVWDYDVIASAGSKSTIRILIH